MSVEYRTYNRRWGVLATVISINFACFTQTSCYFSVTPIAAEYFDANDVKMDLFHLLGMVFTSPFILVALYAINKIGLKVKTNCVEKLNMVCYWSKQTNLLSKGGFLTKLWLLYQGFT